MQGGVDEYENDGDRDSTGRSEHSPGRHYLGVSPDTVRRLIRNGTIPHARIGNSIRIRRADLDGYLEGQISRQWQPVDNRGSGFKTN